MGAMDKPQPQKQHQWLARLDGEWTMEGEAMMGPGQPVQKFRGTERTRSLGGLWFLVEGEGEGPVGGVSTSMMTNMWIYEGALDADEKVLTLDTEGPSMSGDGTLSKYKDRIEFRSDDERIMTSHAQGADGTWTQLMTMTLRRK